jgi:uncharacterized protein YejL (UPF0352 family)
MKVESVLSELLAILNADRADYFLFGLGLMVVVWLVTYTALMVKNHYSGDYSIEDRGNKKTNGEVP